MHSSGSILKTYCEKVRHYLDDPDLDAKYDDNYLVRFFLPSAMTDVISRVSQMSDAQILSSFQITVNAGTTHYKLPPAVAQVVRIGSIETQTGLFVEDLKPRNQFHLNGPGWTVQGNAIVFQPGVEYTKTYTVVFVPSGDIQCHYVSTATGALTGTAQFILPTTLTLGTLDKRPNAYQGSYLRIFGANVTDEIVIAGYDADTRDVTPSITPVNAAGPTYFYSYEIVPFLLEPMIDAISISAAMRAGVGRKINQAHMQSLMLAYKQAIKTAHDTLANMNGRVGKSFFSPTIDSTPGFYVGPSIGTSSSSGSSGGLCDCNDVASATTQAQILATVDQILVALQNGVSGGTWNNNP